jgi:hypothetical protein
MDVQWTVENFSGREVDGRLGFGKKVTRSDRVQGARRFCLMPTQNNVILVRGETLILAKMALFL